MVDTRSRVPHIEESHRKDSVIDRYPTGRPMDGLYFRVVRVFARERELEYLAAILGVNDEELLGDLLTRGFTVHTVPAIEMIPLIFAAWGSEDVTADESNAVLAELEQTHLSKFPEAVQLVWKWLRERPDHDLWELWTRYADACMARLSKEEQVAWRQRLKNQVRRIARASGGWLGVGAICEGEKLVIDAIDQL